MIDALNELETWADFFKHDRDVHASVLAALSVVHRARMFITDIEDADSEVSIKPSEKHHILEITSLEWFAIAEKMEDVNFRVDTFTKWGFDVRRPVKFYDDLTRGVRVFIQEK